MEQIFDLIIFFYLGTVGVYVVHGLHFWKETTKRAASLAIFCLLALSWLVVFYGSFIEPRILVVHQEELRLSDEPTQRLRAVILSDLHVGPFKKTDWARKVVERVNNLRPDVILIAGDFVVESKADVRYLQPLRELSATYGVFAVTGNHEYRARAASEVIEVLREAGVVVLENESVELEVSGKTLRIAGVSDIWFEGDVRRAMKDVAEEDPTLLLAHNPDVVLDAAARTADAVIAGHTHGGQIRLPFIGPIPALPTKLGRRYDKGWFDYEGTKLFITTGVAETGTRARLFVPPEIVEMQIHF